VVFATLPALLGILGAYGFLLLLDCFWSGRSLGSAAILATCSLYYAHTRLLILTGRDSFSFLALLSFLLAAKSPSPRTQNSWLLGFYAGSALAVLTKGIIGAVIPGTIILLWTIPWKRWSELKLAFKPWGVLLFFLIAAPWHILVSLKNPEFPILLHL
jgi:4-amino-4-deoxy-L-arabinose transferase-like glycosyltransferase